MLPGEILRLLGGHAGRGEILRHCSRRALEKAVASGDVQRIRRGRYALARLPDVVKMAAAKRGKLSHESAAQFWQMEAIAKPRTVHITVRRNAHRAAERSVTWHYADVEDGKNVTSPLQTVLDCARTLPFREALAIADSALRRRLVGRHELLAAAERLSGHGSAAALRVCRHADERAANPFESSLRAILVEAGIEGFSPQLLIHDDGTWRVDLGDDERQIALEADSFAFHGTRAALERDCRRYDELVSRDWLVLRFSWEQVMFDPGWVCRMIQAGCRLRDNRKGGPRHQRSQKPARRAA